MQFVGSVSEKERQNWSQANSQTTENATISCKPFLLYNSVLHIILTACLWFFFLFLIFRLSPCILQDSNNRN